MVLGISFSGEACRACIWRDNDTVEHVCVVNGPEIPARVESKAHFDRIVAEWAEVFRTLREHAAKRLGEERASECQRATVAVPGFFGVHLRLALTRAAAAAGVEIMRIGLAPEMACVAHWHEHVAVPSSERRKESAADTSGSGDVSSEDLEEEELMLYVVDDDASLSVSLVAQAEGVSEVRSTVARTLRGNDACNLVDVVKQVVADARLFSGEQQKLRVVLVGSTTRIHDLRRLFPRIEISLLPHEFVAHGASIVAAMLTGNKVVREVLIIASYPFSMGVRSCDGSMVVVCHRDMAFPHRRTEYFTTCNDEQTETHFHLYEGESGDVTGNTYLGSLRVAGLPPAPRGVPSIELSVSMNVSGEVEMAARNATHNEAGQAAGGGAVKLVVDDFFEPPAEIDQHALVKLRTMH